MESGERQPETDQDPRGQDTGSGGYPEAEQGGADPSSGGQGRQGREEKTDAPSQDSSSDESPGNATGNPDAAG